MREVNGESVFSILDWKTDFLIDEKDYASYDALKKQTGENYAIQRVLYSYCLIKWLKQFYDMSEEEIFNKHFGGIYYVFVRGCKAKTGNGIYAHTWDNWERLNRAFDDIIKGIYHG